MRTVVICSKQFLGSTLSCFHYQLGFRFRCHLSIDHTPPVGRLDFRQSLQIYFYLDFRWAVCLIKKLNHFYIYIFDGLDSACAQFCKKCLPEDDAVFSDLKMTPLLSKLILLFRKKYGIEKKF